MVWGGGVQLVAGRPSLCTKPREFGGAPAAAPAVIILQVEGGVKWLGERAALAPAPGRARARA